MAVNLNIELRDDGSIEMYAPTPMSKQDWDAIVAWQNQHERQIAFRLESANGPNDEYRWGANGRTINGEPG